MDIFINTWVFENDVKNGVSQSDLFNRVKNIGADGIEIRREYFESLNNKELKNINDKRIENDLLVNFSVPDEIFEDDGSINPMLKQYFKEAEAMGINKIKFNLGNFKNYTGNLKKDFSEFQLDEIQMNIENDQTKISGDIDNIKYFLEEAKKYSVNIGYVYDLGNWAFTKQNAERALNELGPFIDYIHLKNTINNHGELETSNDLNTGIYDWKHLLREMPKSEIALEYPMDNDDLIKKQLKLVENEVR